MMVFFVKRRGFSKRKIQHTRVFFAKVPKIDALGFVTKDSGDVILVRFNDIFIMYHMYPLNPSIVHLVALSMAHHLLMHRDI